MVQTKILVVDDDEKTVDLVKLYLEKDGYRVLAAYDGWQALELARQKRPDLRVQCTHCDRAGSDAAGRGWSGRLSRAAG